MLAQAGHSRVFFEIAGTGLNLPLEKERAQIHDGDACRKGSPSLMSDAEGASEGLPRKGPRGLQAIGNFRVMPSLLRWPTEIDIGVSTRHLVAEFVRNEDIMSMASLIAEMAEGGLPGASVPRGYGYMENRICRLVRDLISIFAGGQIRESDY
jgi:hypothetical protein